MIAAALALAITACTLGLVVARPRGLNEGVASLAGGALVLLFGLVSPQEALRREAGEWNVFLFFPGMMALAALAERSGIFDRLAYAMARAARGRTAMLYAAVFLLGAGISLLFANDTAALVLTPIVYALVLRLALDPLPFVFATTFIADTASVGLPVSNPLNVIVADSFHLRLGPYVGRLWLPALLVVVVNGAVFSLWFRRDLRGHFDPPAAPITVPGLPSTAALLILLAGAYLAASAAAFPLGVVAVLGAVALALNLARLGRLEPRAVAREIGWPIFGFLGGMLVIVQSLANTGVTGVLGRGLVALGSGSPPAAIAVSTVGSALGANLINNLPMALVMVSAVHPLAVTPAVKLDLVYGTVLGSDLGPNLTHLGSLATFIWLFFLRRKGLDISTWEYFKLGLLVTPPMLLAAILGLYLTAT